MKPDQLARLESLRDRLVEVTLADADPDNWVGAGKMPAEMTREERGDAKWCRSMALATVSLTMQVQRLMLDTKPGASADVVDDEIEADVARYEAAAAKVLAKARHAT